MRDPSINRATVYRTLKLLKKLCWVDELYLMHLEGEKHFYEIRTGINHVHLACFECGQVEEFTSPIFDQLKTKSLVSTQMQVERLWLPISSHFAFTLLEAYKARILLSGIDLDALAERFAQMPDNGETAVVGDKVMYHLPL